MSDRPGLIIRADANAEIGTGHVMRCLALAQAWQDKEGTVTFVGQIASQSLRQRISDEGCSYLEINHSYPEPDDLQIMLSLNKNSKESAVNWLVVDGYHFTADYVRSLHQTGTKVLVIDDYAHQDEYQADLLLNQNLGSEKLSYKINDDAVILAGNRYVLLRREFIRQKSNDQQNIAESAGNILVTMGGADPENVTMQVIEALEQVALSGIKVKIVAGAANPHLSLLEKRLARADFAWELLNNVNDMAPLMRWADVAVTAGGSTCWELACLGVPALIFTIAKNQIGVAEAIAQAGAGLNCGNSHNLRNDKLAEVIRDLCKDKLKRANMSLAGRKLVDGQGAGRVTEKMLPWASGFRAVRENDCRLLFNWANDPVVRRASFCKDTIGWEVHQRWFNDRFCDENYLMLIVLGENEQPAGLVRFDIAEDKAVISINLPVGARNKGQGSRIIKSACTTFFDSRQTCMINAFIRKDNEQSLKVFEQAGFKLASEYMIHGIAAVKMQLLGQ